MALKTTRWDSADYLRTEEERAAYLDACMEEAPYDPAFIANALGVVARSRNMSQLARDTGLTREGLYKALSKEGNPSFGTVLKVVNALGYRLALVSAKTARVTKRIATGKSDPQSGAAGKASTRSRKHA
jgi:probable addiction module antidote protein